MKKIAFLIMLVCFVSVIHAEDVPDAELFGGFSFTRGDLDLNMYGWNASIAGVVNEWFSIVGDLSGHYADVGGGVADAAVRMHSFAIGPQFSARGKSAVGFAHALVGANRIDGVVEGCGGGKSYFEIIAGGGVDIPVNKSLAVRVIQADWVHIRTGDSGVNQARLSAGLVVRF